MPQAQPQGPPSGMRKPPGGGLIIPDSKDVADFAKEGPISLPGNLPPPETAGAPTGFHGPHRP